MAGDVSVRVLSNRLSGALQDEVRRQARQVVRETAEEIATDAKQRAPVDTGRLRSSIHAQMTDELSAVVGTDVEYAVHQEFGTHRMAAHPFLTPAAEAARPRFAARLRKLTG